MNRMDSMLQGHLMVIRRRRLSYFGNLITEDEVREASC